MKTIRLFKVFLLLFIFSVSANATTDANDKGETKKQTTETTAMTSCADFVSANTPLVLPDTGAVTTEDVISVPNEISIEDMTVTITIQHTWNNDLDINLVSPSGTSILIMDGDTCAGNEDDIDVILNDTFPIATCSPGSVPAISGSVAPSQPLAGFNGENTIGDWTLVIDDAFNGDGGFLNVWEMQICGSIPDNDGDGIEDALDPDDDNDGIDDTADNCQFTANADQADWDQDGIGNVCDDNTFITLVPGNAITPNGDGYNDTWMITNSNFYPNMSIQVFNRWGKEVFVSKGAAYNNDWNGESTEGGSGVLPAGSYYYVINPNNPSFGTIGTTPFTGWMYVNY
jgi:gliding motility-associated-like protein